MRYVMWHALTSSISRPSQFSADTGELGMLSVSAGHLGSGLGRRLLLSAEAHCKAAGCTQMRLELLAPRDSPHPTKKWLDAWYARQGYAKGAPDDFAAAFPRIAPLLAVPCVFTVYLKPL